MARIVKMKAYKSTSGISSRGQAPKRTASISQKYIVPTAIKRAGKKKGKK